MDTRTFPPLSLTLNRCMSACILNPRHNHLSPKSLPLVLCNFQRTKTADTYQVSSIPCWAIPNGINQFKTWELKLHNIAIRETVALGHYYLTGCFQLLGHSFGYALRMYAGATFITEHSYLLQGLVEATRCTTHITQCSLYVHTTKPSSIVTARGNQLAARWA